MIKKAILCTISGIILQCAVTFSYAQSFETANIGLILNDSKVTLSNPIIVSNGKSFISLREAIEKFPTNRKVSIGWDGESKTVILTVAEGSNNNSNKKIIKLTVGDKHILVNGISLPLQDALVLYNGRTYFPIRSIASVLGFNVSWDGENSVIKITSPQGLN